MFTLVDFKMTRLIRVHFLIGEKKREICRIE